MNILVLGAAGNTGQRLVAMAVEDGHSVSAFVRNRSKFNALLPELKDEVNVLEGDLLDPETLAEAMAGQDVVVNAAGNAQDGPAYRRLVGHVISVASGALPAGTRFWLFGGAAALEVPGEDFSMLRFRQIPKVFKAHGENLEQVRETQLDWSMLCPGPMVDSSDGQPHEGLRTSAHSWPVPRPAITRFLPRWALLIAFVRAMPEMTITYDDAARVIMDNLATAGPFSKARVGVALPAGRKLHKKNAIRKSSR